MAIIYKVAPGIASVAIIVAVISISTILPVPAQVNNNDTSTMLSPVPGQVNNNTDTSTTNRTFYINAVEFADSANITEEPSLKRQIGEDPLY